MAELVERMSVHIGLRAGQEAGLAAMGLSVPAIGRFVEAGGMLLARTAPHQAMAMVGATAGGGVPLLERFAAVGGSVIDLSDARVGFRLAGPGAAARLARLVPIDLHPSRFPPGACAQTMMAHMAVLVLHLSPGVYEVQISRSYLAYAARAVDGAGV